MSLETQFAPSETAPPELVARQAALIEEHELLTQFYESVTDIILVLNVQRQIIYANRNALNLFGAKEPSEVYGWRPGNMLKCCNANSPHGGCGTTDSCRKCGVLSSILRSQQGKSASEEARLLRDNCEGAMDLLVKTSSLHIAESLFSVVAITDISDEKRRRVLERIFFHDIMNTASGIKGLAELLNGQEIEDVGELHGLIEKGASQMIEEIQTQRELNAAESGDLEVNPVESNTSEVLGSVVEFYNAHPSSAGRTIELIEYSQEITFRTDRILVSRVLGNMVKNALEACPSGNRVRITCSQEGEEVCFSVHNPSYMSEDTQLQVFQRSFSTKGSGRGIGTYSMKLLTERYLHGQIGFKSDESEGTTFWVRLPKNN